jgi:hypothetical protein
MEDRDYKRGKGWQETCFYKLNTNTADRLDGEKEIRQAERGNMERCMMFEERGWAVRVMQMREALQAMANCKPEMES